MMPRYLFQHETTAPELDGFIRILSNVARRALGLEEPPRYVVYQAKDRDGLTHFWATVSIIEGLWHKNTLTDSWEE